MKIAVITARFSRNRPEITEIIKANRKKYIEKHGYDFICETQQQDPRRPPEWEKILLIQKHLRDYNWLFWTDADSLIINTNIKLESLIDNNFNLILTNDNTGINTGIFLVRGSSWSETFMRQTYAQEQFINDPIREEAAIRQLILLNEQNSKYVKYLDQSTMNSYPSDVHSGVTYKEGDFIIHLKGYRKNP